MTWQLVGNVAGKDADVGVIEALKAEVATLRAELSVLRASPSLSEVKAMMADMVKAEIKAYAPNPDQIEVLVGKAFAERPAPVNGKDGTSVFVDDLVPVIVSEVQRAVAAIPAPKNGLDGKSVTLDDVRPLIVAEVAKLPTPKNGEPGKSVDPVEVEALISAKVKAAVSAIPVPKDGLDGKSFTAEDAAPLIAASVEKAFAAVQMPKDGVGISGALIDNEGALILSLTDGSTKNLGLVVGRPGRDGMPGVPGRSGLDGKDAIDGKPGQKGDPGKDGRDGLNGKDGLGFEDLSVDFHEQKGWSLRFVKGTLEKTFPLPIPFDAGVWQPGKVYPKGAGVTVKGGFWIAQKETNTRPGDPGSAWRMSVKPGHDGKPGPPGRDGMGV